MPAARYVGYLRVSTQRQGASGLGIEAQRRAIIEHVGDPARLVAEHVEVESGRHADRPELARALAACRMRQATLLIAKLDRLARNVAFVSNLMESGVEFVACDFPQANRLTVHILAAVAEHEHQMISARTKAALAVAKARGVKLGGDPASLKNRELGWRRSAQARREQADRRAADFLPLVEHLRADGALTYAALAAGLNARGVPAPRGGRWFPASVRQLTLVKVASR